jgi:hypothetical protein
MEKRLSKKKSNMEKKLAFGAKGNKNDDDNENLFENLDELLSTIKRDINQMKKRRNIEKDANAKLLANKTGEPINFGTKI